MCVCVCARARARVCVCVCVNVRASARACACLQPIDNTYKSSSFLIVLPPAIGANRIKIVRWFFFFLFFSGRWNTDSQCDRQNNSQCGTRHTPSVVAKHYSQHLRHCRFPLFLWTQSTRHQHSAFLLNTKHTTLVLCHFPEYKAYHYHHSTIHLNTKQTHIQQSAFLLNTKHAYHCQYSAFLLNTKHIAVSISPFSLKGPWTLILTDFSFRSPLWYIPPTKYFHTVNRGIYPVPQY